MYTILVMADSHTELSTASLYGQLSLGSSSFLGPSSTPEDTTTMMAGGHFHAHFLNQTHAVEPHAVTQYKAILGEK